MIVNDSVAIITGAASGFGKALAERLISLKGKVILGDVNDEQGNILAALLNKQSPNSAYYQNCNVHEKSQLQSLFDLAKQKFGKIDIVVNNAGIIEKTPFITNVQDDWIKVVEIDFNSVVLGTRLALAEFEKQNSPGVILNTASLAGLVPTSFQPVYAAVKAGVVHFSRSLGYLGKKGIRVNCICPSFVKTALTKEALEKGYPIPNWVELDLVIDAFMMAIQDDTLAGEAIRITPERGIDVPFRKIPKAKL